MKYDVLIAGGGPAGAVCALLCARAGLDVLVLERARFPRDKVCGDCLNPLCWPIFQRLGIEAAVRALPHSAFRSVSISTLQGREFRFALPPDRNGEIGLRRLALDQLLLTTAATAGATVLEENPVQNVQSGWKVRSGEQEFHADWLVAADGRNSSVARLLGLLPASRKDRVGLQTHFPLPAGYDNSVRMELLPEGYSGGAAIGENLWNFCLVAHPHRMETLKQRMMKKWQLPEEQSWRSITPLARAAVRPLHEKLLLVGDAARVVEPFTGEGIFYALRSGELAGRAIVAALQKRSANASDYAAQHRQLYRRRLWINQLSRAAVLHPQTTSWLLENFPIQFALGWLTRKIAAPGSLRSAVPA